MGMEISEKIRNMRLQGNYTQKELADYLNVDVSTYAHYEKGDRSPDAKKLSKLARFYKLGDEMLGAELPIETFVSYKKKDIDNLRRCLDRCEWRKDDYEYNKWQYETLKKAVEPVLKSREEALSLPKVDLNHIEAGQEVIKVKLDCVGEALIEWYLKESDKFFEML